MFTPVKTITKKELLDLLTHLSDDANIYVHMEIDDAERASIAAKAGIAEKVGKHDELFVGLKKDVLREADGLSLIAYFQK